MNLPLLANRSWRMRCSRVVFGDGDGDGIGVSGDGVGVDGVDGVGFVDAAVNGDFGVMAASNTLR